MKITSIKKLCTDAHMCMIYETDGNRQWIGTMDAIYPVDELQITKNSIPTLFDMPDADKRMEIGVEDIFKSELVPSEEEIAVEMEGWKELDCSIPIFYLGEKIYPLTHRDGILFVQSDYVKPAIRKNDYLVFKLARNSFGHPLIVIGNGMSVTGIARPLPGTTAEKIVELLGKLGEFRADGSPEKDETCGGVKTAQADGQLEIVYAIEEGHGMIRLPGMED